MAGDTSLLPVVVGGLLALGGVVAGVIGTAIRDVVQQRRDDRKRRADKFEELVAAVYEFEHWMEGMRGRETFGLDVPRTVSPLAKVQAISSVYFPQFEAQLTELETATTQYRKWMRNAGARRVAGDTAAALMQGYEQAYAP